MVGFWVRQLLHFFCCMPHIPLYFSCITPSVLFLKASATTSLVKIKCVTPEKHCTGTPSSHSTNPWRWQMKLRAMSNPFLTLAPCMYISQKEHGGTAPDHVQTQTTAALQHHHLLSGFHLHLVSTSAFASLSGKKRKPAWTDRILWRIKPKSPPSEEDDEKVSTSTDDGQDDYPFLVTQDKYTSDMSYGVSDHKPVIATFCLEVRVDLLLDTRTLFCAFKVHT